MNSYPHEQLLQTLSAMLIELNTLQMQVASPTEEVSFDVAALRESLDNLAQMTRELLHVVRMFSEELSLPELDGVSLADALSLMIDETVERLGLSSRVAFSGTAEPGALSPTAERLLFLVAREAFYQIAQHAGVRKVRLTLHYSPEDVQLSIEDDGSQAVQRTEEQGTDPAPPFDSATILNRAKQATSIMDDLRCRLEYLGGSLEITFLEGRGTRVQAHLPYASHVQQEVAGAIPAGSVPVVPGNNLSDPAVATSIVDPVRILLVDSQAVTRAGLHRLLESYAGLLVVGEAADGIQAVSETLELGPQVVLMDTQLPGGQSLEALRQIKQLNMDARVLLLAAQDREEYFYEALRMGADGYVLKDIAPDELAQSVRMVARGQVVIQPQLADRLLTRIGRQGRNAQRSDALTARELEVLRLLARGLRNKEIAARLFVSERTVNFHLANIYQKLQVSGRTEALSKALEQGLIGV